MADNTTTPPPSLPEAVSVIHNTPVQHKKPRVVKTPKSRKAVKSPKLFATAPAQVTLTPSPPEVILNVPDTSVQSKKPRAIKTPKSRKAPRTPKTPATAPGQVPDVVDTPRTPATALAQALNAVVTLSLPEATVTPILIDGSPPSKPTVTLKKLEQLPILNEVIVRPSKSFTKLKKRMQNEEGWVGTQRGEIAEKSCHECSKGCGPFTLCCIVEDLFQGACANCHYGGSASRCSFRQDQQNAEAHLIAEHVPAPIIPSMAAGNYTGGSLLHSNFQLAGSADAPLLTHLPIPEQATPGVTRGGGNAGPRRIAPTPAPQHGFGKTVISRKAHAMSLTPAQREAAAMEYMKIVKTLKEVAEEEGDESWSFEMNVFEKKNEEKMVEEKKPKQGKKRQHGE